MKPLSIGVLIMLFSHIAQAEHAFEIISLQYKPEVTFEQQQKAMLSLNDIVTSFEGFISRDYYYSQELGRWIEFIVWESEVLAKKASEQVMSNPQALEAFSLVDEKTMIFSHYQHMGGASSQ